MAENLRDTGISVTALCPGLTDTDMADTQEAETTQQETHEDTSQDTAVDEEIAPTEAAPGAPAGAPAEERSLA